MGPVLIQLTIALALVLLVRKPVRRAFGAGPAFTLWLLPPLLACLPWLPAAPVGWSIVPPITVLPAAMDPSGSVPGTAGMPWLPWLWFAGSVAGVLRLALHYGRLLHQCRRMPISPALRRQLPDPRDRQRLRLHAAGPAVLWAPRSLLLLPADFLSRFDAHEQRLVLRHELAHLRRGDPLWSLLAELAAALLWFHPLAWLALPRLRLDQELACDERVLSELPREETRYARTLLRSTGMDAAPVLIPWLSQPQLKERLNMIRHHRPDTLRRRIGFLTLALLMGGAACMTQAATGQGKLSDRPATQNMDHNLQLSPVYPESAIRNKEEGTVILLMQIGTDGKPMSFKVDPATKASPDLIKAASDAAMGWRFNPGMKDGKPVVGYARVPVMFTLDPQAPKPPATSTPSPASSNT